VGQDLVEKEVKLKFGQTIADELRRRRPRPGEKWHLDEVQQGVVLDILVQSRRN
jgi:putative transposase